MKKFRDDFSKSKGFKSWSDLAYQVGSETYLDELMKEYALYYNQLNKEIVQYKKQTNKNGK